MVYYQRKIKKLIVKKIIQKNKKWTDDKVKYLKDNYNKISYREISDYLNMSYNSISHKAHRLGLDSRNLWTKEEDKIILENYEHNPNVWNLLNNRSYTAIKKRARYLGVIRKCGNYSINFKFFENWNNESAYILGFFCADGCIEPHLNRISCELSLKDYDHLLKIRNIMGSTNPICKKKTRNSAALFIHNRKMVVDAINKGLIPNKTNRVRLPDIPDKYLHHFIRGYIDGDGSIWYDGSLRICILGNYKFINDMKEKIQSKYNIVSPNMRIHNKGSDKCWNIKYSGKNAAKLSDVIYRNTNGLYLNRKHDKAKVIARGETPGIINSAQISQVGAFSIEEPERKTDFNQIGAQRLNAEPSYEVIV